MEVVWLELLAFLDKLSPILIVIIPSYFSFKSTQNTKETDKQISLLSDKISAIEKQFPMLRTLAKIIAKDWVLSEKVFKDYSVFDCKKT